MNRYLRGAPSLVWLIYKAGLRLHDEDPGAWEGLFRTYWLTTNGSDGVARPITGDLRKFALIVNEVAHEEPEDLDESFVAREWRQTFLPRHFIGQVADALVIEKRESAYIADCALGAAIPERPLLTAL